MDTRTTRSVRRLLTLALLAAAAAVVAETQSLGRLPADAGRIQPATVRAEAAGSEEGAASVDPDAAHARIAAHLARVEAELRASDIAHLNAAQQAARRRNLDILREYRLHGVFPINHDFPGQRQPYFVDDYGTPCAMAYLIARSGRLDIVDRVARTKNNALIAELASDPELVAWLDSAGLSADEAGRIQPKYDHQPPSEPDPNAASTAYGLATVAATGFNLATTLWNAQGWSEPSRTAGALGIAGGALSLGLGAAHIGGAGQSQSLAAWNVAVGLVASTLGVRAVLAGPRPSPERAASGDLAYPRRASLEAAPTFSADGGAGMAFRLSF